MRPRHRLRALRPGAGPGHRRRQGAVPVQVLRLRRLHRLPRDRGAPGRVRLRAVPLRGARVPLHGRPAEAPRPPRRRLRLAPGHAPGLREGAPAPRPVPVPAQASEPEPQPAAGRGRRRAQSVRAHRAPVRRRGQLRRLGVVRQDERRRRGRPAVHVRALGEVAGRRPWQWHGPRQREPTPDDGGRRRELRGARRGRRRGRDGTVRAAADAERAAQFQGDAPQGQHQRGRFGPGSAALSLLIITQSLVYWADFRLIPAFSIRYLECTPV